MTVCKRSYEIGLLKHTHTHTHIDNIHIIASTSTKTCDGTVGFKNGEPVLHLVSPCSKIMNYFFISITELIGVVGCLISFVRVADAVAFSLSL